MKESSWKVSELSGCGVFDKEGNRLGYLADALPTRSNDVWVVKSETRKGWEMLVPATKAVVLEVDAAGRKIVIDPPPGLKELYEG
ncbi:MAG: hypothetical protein A2339_00220 [Elusimicrobia bacterium RIFOXYB12_FULL_50_12]|nr:MAG: hypothetical protein A2278_06090 [Elusimicrobia bacterium RIFOXYA12_FULL_49_49]OGS10344.1 MAG: hypothetical protein A2386_04775 [Elusimicrobia bacterium RIFOXYB1_FULL_48_9]OGS16638.1 MAG: hypothetical protein A2251_04645 [Elusimicrobia bacterium RIFOXYA2_FULL_47_53]OGS25487.1 MAG: hypothetical protein A2339_00220 [Elusimicrobia bacterium RIFOXYB12_FULL_50_12]OGS31616.1 MAG: hypothetical protein A2323_03365 [Elusimicrobia bacterium RIFOXYB2_FULL_46_23]